MVECLENDCRFFQACYQVIGIGENGYGPDFELTKQIGLDKRCMHPGVDNRKHRVGCNPGLQIQSIKHCPKDRHKDR